MSDPSPPSSAASSAAPSTLGTSLDSLATSVSTTGDSPDWPAQATEAIVGMVDNVKGKTTRPAVLASRGLVYGLVLLLVGVPVLVLFIVGLFRFLDHAIPYGVWLTYLGTGLLLSAIGLLLWSKRTA